MRKAFCWSAAAALAALVVSTTATAQPKIKKGVEATLKIPATLLTEGRSWGGRYYYVTVEMTDQGPVVASRADWLTVVPEKLADHRVLKISGWKKPEEEKGVRLPGYTEVSLLRNADREIVRLRFLDIREGPDLDRAFWEVAFSGTLSPEQAREYLDGLRSAAAIRREAAPVAARVDRDVKSRYFTTSDGIRLHYLDAGEGPAVIFVTGWTIPAEIWAGQMEALSLGHRVIALDPRSQGRSEVAGEGLYPERRAQDIRELAGHLEVSPVVLVGWSMGVQELLAYVEAYGTGSVAGLVLVDGPVVTGGERIQTTRKRILYEIQRDRRNLTERFIRGLFKTPQNEAYVKRLVEGSLRTPTSAAFTLLGEYLVMERNLAEALDGVDCPLLYAITPGMDAEASEVSRRVRDARVEVFEGAGHALFVDRADRFNDLLKAFLGQP